MILFFVDKCNVRMVYRKYQHSRKLYKLVNYEPCKYHLLNAALRTGYIEFHMKTQMVRLAKNDASSYCCMTHRADVINFSCANNGDRQDHQTDSLCGALSYANMQPCDKRQSRHLCEATVSTRGHASVT